MRQYAGYASAKESNERYLIVEYGKPDQVLSNRAKTARRRSCRSSSEL
jgi:hypothetical protein